MQNSSSLTRIGFLNYLEYNNNYIEIINRFCVWKKKKRRNFFYTKATILLQSCYNLTKLLCRKRKKDKKERN